VFLIYCPKRINV